MGLRRQVGVGILVQLVILLVGFWRVYSVYFHLVVGLGKKRGWKLVLLSSYREHLSRSFPGFLVRAQLHVDIPLFKPLV